MAKIMPKKPHNASSAISEEMAADLLGYLAKVGNQTKVGDFPYKYFSECGWDIREWKSNPDKTAKGEPGRVARGLKALIEQGLFVAGVTAWKQCGTRNSAAALTKGNLSAVEQAEIAVAFEKNETVRNARTRSGVMLTAHKEIPEVNLRKEAEDRIEAARKAAELAAKDKVKKAK